MVIKQRSANVTSAAMYQLQTVFDSKSEKDVSDSYPNRR